MKETWEQVEDEDECLSVLLEVVADNGENGWRRLFNGLFVRHIIEGDLMSGDEDEGDEVQHMSGDEDEGDEVRFLLACCLIHVALASPQFPHLSCLS